MPKSNKLKKYKKKMAATMTKEQVKATFIKGVNEYKAYKRNNPNGIKKLKIFIKAAFAARK